MHPRDAAATDGNAFDGDAGAEFDAMLPKMPLEGLHHVRRIIGNGKDPSAAFRLGFHTIPFQECDEVLPEEPVKDAVQESAVRPIHGEKMFVVARVRQIAPALPADEDLLPRTVRLLKKEDPGPHFRGPPGGHHPARAGADNDHRIGFCSRSRGSAWD